MAHGLTEVRRSVEEAAHRSGRDPEGITIVVISKYASDEAVRSAYEAGVRDFGENRAHELERRVAILPGDVRWHFVGRLQSNKVRRVRPVASLLHSFDRPDLCEPWVKGRGSPPPVLVQVNVSGEPQKAGARPEDAEDLVSVAESYGIVVSGLMTMAPFDADPEASRPHFAELRRLRDDMRSRHPDVVHLSMGMTQDFVVAVEEGATILRVGRAIFDATRSEG